MLSNQDWVTIWQRIDRHERNESLVSDYLDMRKGIDGPRSLRELGEKYGIDTKRTVAILRRYGVHKPAFLHFGADAT